MEKIHVEINVSHVTRIWIGNEYSPEPRQGCYVVDESYNNWKTV